MSVTSELEALSLEEEELRLSLQSVQNENLLKLKNNNWLRARVVNGLQTLPLKVNMDLVQSSRGQLCR